MSTKLFEAEQLPSHKLHDKWAKKYGIPSYISERVNKIIDLEYVHDLGEVKKRKLYGVLPITNVTVNELRYVLESEFQGLEYIYSIKAALLHHFLDKIEREIKEIGEISKKHPQIVIDLAYDKMRDHYLYILSEAELEEIYMFLKRHADIVVNDIIADMKRRGVKIGLYGHILITFLLSEYVKKNMHKGLIWVSGISRPLPISSAAKIIVEKLKRNKEVAIQFCQDPCYSPYTPPYKFRNIEDLINFLKK